MDGDELGARLQLLKPYHRATALGDQAMPKLGIFKETHTVTFATQVRRLILHTFANGGDAAVVRRFFCVWSRRLKWEGKWPF